MSWRHRREHEFRVLFPFKDMYVYNLCILKCIQLFFFFSEKGFPTGGVAGIVTGSIIIVHRNTRERGTETTYC